MINYKKFIISTAKEAGKIAASNFRIPQKTSWKGKNDIVTETDFKVNEYVVSKIKKYFPDHNIISEESPSLNNHGDYTWFIDPIDGTIAFSYGIPFFCAALALAYKNRIIYSAIYDPVHEELFFAQKSKGSFLNGRKIEIKSNPPKLKKAAISFGVWVGAPYDLMNLRNEIASISYYPISTHSVSLAACYLTLGRIDGVIFAGSAPWDIAPLTLICEESGIKVTDITGVPWVPPNESKGAIAASSNLHKELMKLVRKYYKS